MTKLLDLQNFFPQEMELISKTESPQKISIKVKSRTQKQKCPRCGCESLHYHSTYTRNIIELPILGKSVLLIVTAYKYDCENHECEQKVFCEKLSGFTGRYRRMTARCEEIISAIALNTSCEAASLICKHMGVPVSGDTIIRILLRNSQSEYPCGEIIGVDDWAYKKRDSYGTIVCDAQTHKPVALLDGRDGKELKEWLERNKHIKIVTRDRASSYAKAISEALPDAIQIADRFHLHHNLLQAVKDAIGRELPEKVEVENKTESITDTTDTVKKNAFKRAKKTSK